MSTDYGYGCKNCDERAIVDNARTGDIPMLRAALDVLEAIVTVRGAGLYVRPESDALCNFTGAIDFAIKHVERGHRVSVFDEYGCEYDQCTKRTDCPTCRRTHAHCKLKHGHDGECSPTEGT